MSFTAAQLITAGIISLFTLLVLIGMVKVFARVTEIGREEKRLSKP
jgi:hypothetical protein